MFLKLTILAALAAFSAFGQNTDAAKPKPAPAKIEAKVPAQINTAKLWRLLAQAQQLRQQAQQTPQVKAAEKADEAVAAEQQHLTELCGSDFTLGYQQDSKADNAGDLICLPKPPEKPAEVKKEK